MAAKKYVVTGAYVTLQTMTAEGRRLIGFFAGAPVPPDVPDWQIKHHLDNNLIAEVDDPAAVPAAVIHPTPLESLDAPNTPVAERVHENEVARHRAEGAAKAAVTKAAEAKPAVQTRKG